MAGRLKVFPTWLIKLSEVLSESAAAPRAIIADTSHGATFRDISPGQIGRQRFAGGLSDKLPARSRPYTFSTRFFNQSLCIFALDC